MVKGRMAYIPKELALELDTVRGVEQIKSASEAMRRLVNDARIGRKIRLGGGGLIDVDVVGEKKRGRRRVRDW